MIAVHPDWHLASWARGPAGAALLQTLLADPRLQPRLERIAATGRAHADLGEVGADIRCVLDWFNQVSDAALFQRLGVLRHAAVWGASLAANRGKGVPDWVALDDIKRGLKVLHGLAEANGLRSSRPVVGPEAVIAEGQGLVAGWWASLGPDLAADLACLCPRRLSVDLPKPDLPIGLCALAVHAMAALETGGPQPGSAEADPSDTLMDGDFDD